ncbi:MAG: T9SS type A sorting domain-containing protein [Bacteroidetes bacterium]|nr:T9SS type A sorting domain-containing protein [Bacteroidota bacterium]
MKKLLMFLSVMLFTASSAFSQSIDLTIDYWYSEGGYTVTGATNGLIGTGGWTAAYQTINLALPGADTYTVDLTDGYGDGGESYVVNVGTFTGSGDLSGSCTGSFATFTFTLATPTGPGLPTNPNPTDGATGIAVDNNPDISWTNPSKKGAPDYNEVYFSTSLTDVQNKALAARVLNGSPSTVYLSYNQASDLLNNTWYYWRVCETDGTGTTDGPVWSFKTVCATITTFPSLEDFETFSVANNATGYTNCWSTSPSNTTALFRWNVDAGGTTSSNTGPTVDHTTGTDAGIYLFTEASSGVTASEAYVYTPLYDFTALACPMIEFWYHMYGASMGELHLDIDAGSGWVNDIMTPLIGQQQSAQLDPWLQRTVNLSAYSGQVVKFRFRSIRGSSWAGDMAIDDVNVYNVTTPIFSITPAGTKDYGEYPLNNYSSGYYNQTFTVENVGAGTLNVSSTSLTGGDVTQFTLTDGNTYPVSLTSGQTMTFDVSFTPNSTGAKTTTLRVVADAKADHDVTLIGTAYVAPPRNLTGTATATPSVDLTWDIPIPEGEVKYDDGSAEQWFWAADPSALTHMFYTKFNAPVAGNLNYVAVYNRNSAAGNNWHAIYVCPDDGTGKPDLANAHETFATPAVNSTTGEWNLLQLNTPIAMALNDVFYMVTQWPDGNTDGPYVGTDNNNSSGRCAYSFDGGTNWTAFASNWIMRAYMSSPKDFVIVTPSKPIPGSENLPVIAIKGNEKNQENEIANNDLSYPIPGMNTSEGSKILQSYTVHRGLASGTYTTTFTGIIPTSYTDATVSGSTTYFYAVTAVYTDGTSDYSNEVQVITPPANDECSGAISLPVNYTCTYTTGSNVGATDSGETPTCASYNGGDVWFSAVVPATGYLVVECAVNGGFTDGGMSAWSGTCASLTEYECDDDDGPGLMPLIEINDMGLAGETLYFSVWEYGNNVFGPFDICAHTIPTAATWNGSAKSNDWHNAGNWDTGIPGPFTDVTIPAGLTNYPTIGASAACNDITIESGATGDASLLDNGYLTVYGNVTAERYLTADDYHNFSPSVSGEFAEAFHLSGATGLDVYLYSHNEASNDFTEVSSLTTPLNPFQGYTVWVDGANATPPVGNWTFDFTGGLNTGNSGSADNVVLSSPGDWSRGWNFFGNPYLSAIDWDAASGWTKIDIDATVYIYNTALDQWATYSLGSGGNNGGSQYIAMGQGFWVKRTNDAVGPYPLQGTLTMDNDVRVHNGVGYLKSEIANIVKLQVTGNEYSDETSILFREDATVGFDSQYDAYKLPSVEVATPQLYSIASTNHAVNVLPETEWVQLGFTAGVNGEYTISATEINDIPSVWLEDTFTGELTNLQNVSYTFTYTVGDDEARFIVHFTPLAVDENAEDMFGIYSYNKDVYVSVPENTKGDIVIYNMMGQEVTSAPINSALNKITLEESAYYVVKVLSDESVVTRKVFIK